MEPWHIAFRAVLAYVILLALLRFSGKRTVSEATTFDLVFALVLGDTVDDLLWGEVGAARFAVAVGVLGLAHVAAALAGARSDTLHDLLEGTPVRLLANGAPVVAGLRKERISRGTLEELLRHEGLEPSRWPELASAQLEDSAQLSCVRRRRFRDAQRRDRDALRRR